MTTTESNVRLLQLSLHCSAFLLDDDNQDTEMLQEESNLLAENSGEFESASSTWILVALADKNLLIGFQVRTIPAMQEMIDAAITEVTETLQVNSGDAVALLRYFKFALHFFFDLLNENLDGTCRN